VEGSAGELGIAAHQYIQSLVPQGNTRNLPKANHYMQLDQPKTIARWMHEFLRHGICPDEPPPSP